MPHLYRYIKMCMYDSELFKLFSMNLSVLLFLNKITKINGLKQWKQVHTNAFIHNSKRLKEE